MDTKSGFQTTEFWGMMMPFIIILALLILVGMGVINMSPELLALVLSALGLGGTYGSGQYSQSRGDVKVAAMESETAREVAAIESGQPQGVVDA